MEKDGVWMGGRDRMLTYISVHRRSMTQGLHRTGRPRPLGVAEDG